MVRASRPGGRDWLRTLFNQPLEVHAFVLGVLVGLVLATLAIGRRPGMALVLTLLVVLFTFGAFEPAYVCAGEYTACRHVQLKPWYFLGGFLAGHLGTLGALRAVGGHRPQGSADSRTASRFAALVLLGLIGLALYSFVTPWPVHPITGLATLGGVVGAAFGLVAYEWAVAGGGRSAGLLATARRVFRADLDATVFVLGYGAAFGFGYPRLLWELGDLVGREGFLLGPVVRARTGWLSVVAYVAAVFLVSVLVRRVQRGTRDQGPPRGRRVAALAFAHVCYGLCLFVATGLAGAVWFRVIPAARI